MFKSELTSNTTTKFHLIITQYINTNSPVRPEIILQKHSKQRKTQPAGKVSMVVVQILISKQFKLLINAHLSIVSTLTLRSPNPQTQSHTLHCSGYNYSSTSHSNDCLAIPEES